MTRKFERLVFDGVPEQPESTWERDGNSYVSMRQTGRSQNISSSSISETSIILGTFTFDHEHQTETFESNLNNLDVESLSK